MTSRGTIRVRVRPRCATASGKVHRLEPRCSQSNGETILKQEFMRIPAHGLRLTRRVQPIKFEGQKGFKFERFDVFSQIQRAPSERRNPEGRIRRIFRRGAATMGGLPFDLARSGRSPQTGQNASRSDSLLASCYSPMLVRDRWKRSEPAEIAGLLSCSNAESRPVPPLLDSRCAVEWQVCRKSHGRSSMRPASQLSMGDGSGIPIVPISYTAHPLQYDQGKDWDDHSTPQKTAERGNEETAQ